MAPGGTPERSVDQEVERILAAYADRFSGVRRDEVETAVRAEFDRWSGVAIPDYVPIFVERSMRSQYGRFDSGARPLDASGPDLPTGGDANLDRS